MLSNISFHLTGDSYHSLVYFFKMATTPSPKCYHCWICRRGHQHLSLKTKGAWCSQPVQHQVAIPSCPERTGCARGGGCNDFSYMGSHSIVLTWVNVGAPDSYSDALISNQCDFREHISTPYFTFRPSSWGWETHYYFTCIPSAWVYRHTATSPLEPFPRDDRHTPTSPADPLQGDGRRTPTSPACPLPEDGRHTLHHQ